MNNKKIADLASSIIRTIVAPGIVGLLATWALYAHVTLPTDIVSTITMSFSFGYWFLVRALETRFRNAGWFLLVPKAPQYTHVDVAGFMRSAVRTFVPLAIGAAVTFATRHGLNIDSKQVEALVAVFTSGSYYSAVRVAETKAPIAGLMLGAKGAPIYKSDNGEASGGDHE